MNARGPSALPVLLFLACAANAQVTAHLGPTGLSEDGGLPQNGTMVAQANAPKTKLPTLRSLTNVVALQREDSAGIDFDPVDGAIDYRVYPLPSDQDITVNADGSTTVANAIYRCAGTRQTFDLPNNLNANDGGLAPADQSTWSAQVSANPLLGYVYVLPGAGRTAVYAAAGYPTDSEIGWRETRLKIYTTDRTQYQALIGQSWRDDGVVFYVPSVASSATQTIYGSQTASVVAGQGWTQREQFYFTDTELSTHTTDVVPAAPAFQILKAPAEGTQPLMAVSYQASQRHTELAVGRERFRRAAFQGQGPLWHLEWAGITQQTTLVVEALGSGCPYQGFLSPQHLEAPPHQTFFTLAEMQSASPTGEAFINGQYDTKSLPRAIARSFVTVSPKPHNPTDWDWYQGFAVGSDFGSITTITGCTKEGCRFQSPIFDFGTYSIDVPTDVPVFAYGQFLGQMWVAFDDTGSDVAGKVRFTALQMSKIDSDPTKFLHVTMSVDIVSTGRRYPQMIVSDQKAPVEEGLANPNHNTLLVQPIEGPSMRIETQAIHGLVNGAPWNVNNQAREHRLIDYDNGQSNGGPPSAAEPPFEHAGMDRITKFDAYISSQRLFVFFDGAPAGCTLYPAGFTLTGPVTVSFGDVLYHEGAADERICTDSKPYSFMHKHQCSETKRHFDDLGFKSAVPAPTWNETKLPCAPY